MAIDLSKSYEYFQPEKVDCRIHIVGCGSVGATVAELLVRLGLTNIALWDMDTVSPHNLANQIFRQQDIGRSKVEALADILFDINPDVKDDLKLYKDGWNGQQLWWGNPKFCVSCKAWCKIEQKYFKAGAAQAAAAFSTKITALRGDVKGGGVSLRSSRLLTFRLQPVSPACGRQRTPPTVRELRSSPAVFRSTSS